MADELAVVVTDIKKSFGSHQVLDGVSLAVKRGTVFALLGANGAGKTTLINILATLSKADKGKAIVAGYDVAQSAEMVREAITVSGQHVTVDTVLTGFENLVLIARLRHVAHPKQIARNLLERFDLVEAGNKPVGTYSGGMQRRLDLALSLIGDPQVVFLDEPSTGLDPAARREVWETIEKLAQSGVTIFLTTQYMDEAERLATTIAILRDGKILTQGSKESIVQAATLLRTPTGEAVRKGEGAAEEKGAGEEETGKRVEVETEVGVGAHTSSTLEDAFLVLTAKNQNEHMPAELRAALNEDTQQLTRLPLMNANVIRKRHGFADTCTFTARLLKHNLRSPDTIMTVLGMPLLILLLFVFVLGGAMDTGTSSYINYIVPAVLLICMASGLAYTSFRVNADVLSGMFDRFRAMPLSRLAFVAGHAASSVIVNGISCIVLLLIALLIGYRPEADLTGWMLAAGLLLFALVAFASMGVAFGVLAKSSEGSGMFSYLLIALLFVSSGFAPTASMPAPLQVFADYQPMTPLINSIRNALLGQSPDAQVWVALAWLAAITAVFSVVSFIRINKHKA